jgi:hypothetical protein
MQHSVKGSFLTTGTAGFMKWLRGVEPDIGAVDKIACHVHIIILDEGYSAAELWVFCCVVYSLDELLPAFVIRMGFAGEDYLDWPKFVPK